MNQEKYLYSIATPDEKQEILDFLLEHFRIEEPLNRAVKFPANDFISINTPIINSCLKDPFSSVARSTDTNDIVGVQLHCIINRTDKKTNVTFSTDSNSGLYALGKILDEMSNAFFELVPINVQRVLHGSICSVAKPFQRQGIASKLMNHGFTTEKLQKYRIDGVMYEATSAANQALLSKYGYKPLKEIYLCDIKGSGGQRLLQTDDGTEKVVLYWKPSEELMLK